MPTDPGVAIDYSLLDIHLIWATERLVETASRHSPMYPDDIPAWLVRRGRVTLRYDDEITEAKAGSWILPKTGAAWHDFTDDARIVSIRFRLRLMDGSELFPRPRTLVLPGRAHAALTQAAEELVGLARSRKEPAPSALPSPAAFFACQAGFYRWLECYAQAVESSGMSSLPHGTDRRLTRARDLLHAQGLSGRIPRRKMAAAVGWSVPQLTRRFSAEYGVTPRRYLERRRFNWACGELVRRERTIKEIASDLGFRSLAQFSNWFARLAGRSPREYRRQIHP